MSIAYVTSENVQLSRMKRQATSSQRQFTQHTYGHYGQQSSNYAQYGHDTRITGILDKNEEVPSPHQYQQTFHGSQTHSASQARNGRFPGEERRNIIPSQHQFQSSAFSSDGSKRVDNQFSDRNGFNQFSSRTSQQNGHQINLPSSSHSGNRQYIAGNLHPSQYQDRKDAVVPGSQGFLDSPLSRTLPGIYPTTSQQNGRSLSASAGGQRTYTPTTRGDETFSSGHGLANSPSPFSGSSGVSSYNGGHTGDIQPGSSSLSNRGTSSLPHGVYQPVNIPITSAADNNLGLNPNLRIGTVTDTSKSDSLSRVNFPHVPNQPGLNGYSSSGLPPTPQESPLKNDFSGQNVNVHPQISRQGYEDKIQREPSRLGYPNLIGEQNNVPTTQDFIESKNTHSIHPGERGLHNRGAFPNYDTRGIQTSHPTYFDSQNIHGQQINADINKPATGVHQPSTNINTRAGQRDYPALENSGNEILGQPSRSSSSPIRTPSSGFTSDRGLSRQQTNSGRSLSGNGDSVSSQTHIQTGEEGTAAEALSFGQYKGTGSQTQVQGKYAGNGSFSAQAQSGFLGGLTQSQVQGGKYGGFSGSSATVENLSSVQSQVQIGQPLGSASSTAQGSFSHGMTQVKAESGRSGGGAGAQSQSRGLSSSQVQVDIKGEEAKENNNFQGTVSASVQGGSTSGQSQTQLQGNYRSGRTYVATAQGNFDATIDFQGTRHGSEVNPYRQTGGTSSLSQPSISSDNNLSQTGQVPMNGIISSEHAGKRDHLNIPSSTRVTSYPGSQPISGVSTQQGHENTALRGQTDSQPSIQHPTARFPGEEKSNFVPDSRGVHSPGTRNIEAHQTTRISPSQFTGLPPASISNGHQTTSGHLPPTTHFQTPYDGMPISPQTDFQGRFRNVDQQTNHQLPSRHLTPSSFHPGSPQTSRDLNVLIGNQDGLQPHYSQSQNRDHHISSFVPSMAQGSDVRPLAQPGTSHLIPTQPKSYDDQIPTTYQQPGLQPTFDRSSLPSPQYPSQTFPQPLPPEHNFSRTFEGSSPFLPSQFQPSLQSRPSPMPPLFPNNLRQVSPPPIISTSDSISSLSNGSPHVQPGQRPGAPEPDSKNEGACCEALKNLKNRCCGRSSRTPQSPCCSSPGNDFMEDFDSDDLFNKDSSNEPCKIVKAICYIVYKPVGKARICKPTNTNSC